MHLPAVNLIESERGLRARERLAGLGIKLASRLAAWIPWIAWRLIASVAGLLALVGPWGPITRENVRHVWADELPRRPRVWWLASRQVASHVLTVAGLLRTGHHDQWDCAQVTIEGFDRIRPHLGRRGVIVVAPHAGPYPLAGLALRRWLDQQGFHGDLAVVVRLFSLLRSSALHQWFARCFARAGVAVISADDAPACVARAILRALRRQGILILLVDEPMSGLSRSVPFFDSTIRLPVGPIRVARATDSILVPCIVTQRGSGGIDIHLAEPIDPSCDAPDAPEPLEAIAAALQDLIRPRVGEWSMLSPIWEDVYEPRRPTGYGVADLHLHTPGSDGLCSIDRWRVAAEHADVDVIAITDHDHVDTVVAWAARHTGVERVIPGVELTARGRIVHLGVLFPDALPAALPQPGTPLLAVVRWARGVPGSVVILVHPLPLLWRVQLRRMARAGVLPDAIETRFPLAAGRSRGIEGAAARYGLAVLGGSDAHLVPGQLGQYVTFFPGSTADDLVAAIRARTTYAAARPGRVALSLSLYPLQTIYSWLLPFHRHAPVARLRARVLVAAQRRSGAIEAPADQGVAECDRRSRVVSGGIGSDGR